PAPQPVLGYVVTQGDIDALEAINATLYIDGSTTAAGANDEIYEGDVVRFEISSGFECIEGNQRFTSGVPSTLFWGYSNIGAQVPIGWTVANIIEDGSAIEGTFDSTWSDTPALIVEARQLTDTVANNHVYLLEDADMLDAVNSERFTLLDPAHGNLLDYGTYILSALNLPFDVDEGIIGARENIR